MQKKAYLSPSITTYGTVEIMTADSRENSTPDTFFGLNGPQAGVGGSFDTCVTPNREDCL